MSSPQPPYPSSQDPSGPPPGYQQQPPPPGYGQAPGGQQYGYQQPYPQQGYGAPPVSPYGQQYAQSFQKPTGWFVVNWLLFWPLAIYSLTSAWGNIDRALFAGDTAGAKFHADRVKKFGIIALCIGAGWILLWIIIAVSIASSVPSCSGYYC